MQCHGWSTTIRSLRFSVFHSTFTPKPAPNAPRFTLPTRLVAHSRPFGSAVLANAPRQTATHLEIEAPTRLSPAALARAASQTIRMCGKEKQFGDALYILNSMRFSIFPPSSSSPPERGERAACTWVRKPEPLRLLSSTPSSIEGYTFINFGQPVPTRLASHSFLHSLLKAGLPVKAAKQAKLMMADGIRIRTKTMESILASTVDRSSYPPTNPPRLSKKILLSQLSKYPIADQHTSVAVRLLEEARNRRQERTEQMYDVVINACLLQGEIIIASLLFVMLIKDWQLRQALANQCANNPPQGPSDVPASLSPFPTRQANRSLLECINRTLTTQKNLQDPSFRNAIQALANLAFAVDTGQYPSRFMGSLIKVMCSVPKSPVIVYIGSSDNVYPVNAYSYIHKVLMKLVHDAGGKANVEKDPLAGRKYNVHSFNALLHYCLRHRLSKTHASDLLGAMEKKWGCITPPSANVLLRSSTLLRDDAIRMVRSSAHTPDSTPVNPLPFRPAELPLTRWAHIANVLKLGLAIRYPSEPVIYTPARPDRYTVTGLISHLIATGRGHIVAEKLYEIIPELNLVDDDGSGILLEQRGRHAVPYGPHFFATVLNALAKNGGVGRVEVILRLAVEAERASWADGNNPWFLPIHAYTCILQRYAKEARVAKVTVSSGQDGGHGGVGKCRRRIGVGIASAMVEGKRIFRTVQARCQFLETAEGRGILGQAPPDLRKFVPDGRYFNALLDLYGRRSMGYARPRNNPEKYWVWLERLTSERFARTGEAANHWHPLLAEIVAEMHKYGYKVPQGFRFLLVGRTWCPDTGDSEPLQPVRPGPPPRRNPQRIPILKTRGLPVSRGKPRRRIRRGV